MPHTHTDDIAPVLPSSIDGPFQIVLLAESTEKFRQGVDRNEVHFDATPDFPESLLIGDVDRFGLRLVVTDQKNGGATP